MNRAISVILFIVGLLAIATSVSMVDSSTIDDLSMGRFVNAEADSAEYLPNEDITIRYTYINSWADSHKFMIEGDLQDQEPTKYHTLRSGETISDTMTFEAPAEDGSYTIKLEGSVNLDGSRYTSGDGKASIPITVKSESTPPSVSDYKLYVNTNVPGSTVSYQLSSETSDSDGKAVFENVPINTDYTFTVTANGYQDKTFTTKLTDSDKTIDVTLSEVDSNTPSTDIIVNVVDTEGFRISDATVSTSGNSEVTDSNGEVTIAMYIGETKITVTHDEYNTYFDTIDVTEDSSEISVTLVDNVYKDDYINDVGDESLSDEWKESTPDDAVINQPVFETSLIKSDGTINKDMVILLIFGILMIGTSVLNMSREK